MSQNIPKADGRACVMVVSGIMTGAPESGERGGRDKVDLVQPIAHRAG